MDLLSGPATNGMPLHCNICPKKPDFSDTSHLLTHVSSKQHLANQFKIKVRSSADINAKRDLDAYEHWYNKWNLDELLNERLSQKERRGRGGGNSTARRGSGGEFQWLHPISVPLLTNSVIATASSSRSTPSATFAPAPRRAQNLRNNILDPQLDRIIKIEPDSRPATPVYIPTLDTSTLHRYGQPYQQWPIPYGHTPSQIGTSNSYGSEYDDDNADDGCYSYLASRSRRNVRRRTSDDFSSEADYDFAPNDSSRLKGEVWPGMDIFDSATPEMRRRRNQKKDTSVLEQLQLASETILPTELVFDADGDLKQEREITGEPNIEGNPLPGETSPEPDEPPLKKRQTRRPRPALTERDANGGRNLRSHRAGSHRPGFGGGRASPYDGSDDYDDRMTYGHRPQRRTGLSIHRDDTGPDITFNSRPSPLSFTYGESLHGMQSYGRHSQPGFSRNSSLLGAHNFHPLSQPTCGYQGGPLAASFRPTEHNIPAMNMASFGTMTQHSMMNAATDFSSAMDGTHQTTAFQPQFTPSVQHAQPAAQPLGFQDNHMHTTGWDMFSAPSNNETNLDAIDFGTTDNLNPLYYDGKLADDDEGTISVPGSVNSQQ